MTDSELTLQMLNLEQLKGLLAEWNVFDGQLDNFWYDFLLKTFQVLFRYPMVLLVVLHTLYLFEKTRNH